MAKTMEEHARAMSEAGASKGGKARAAQLSAEQRKQIAEKAAEGRWGILPKAEYAGELQIAGKIIQCAVLENGKRLLTQESFLKTIGRAGKAKAGTGSERLASSDPKLRGLPPFLAADNLADFIDDSLRESTTPIVFRNHRGQRGFGYDAKLLPMVCEVYLKARDADKLLPAQRHIAEACDLLMRGLAHVGIIALVDEATGYQEKRDRDELNRILEMYINEELRPWVRKFPDEFFKHTYRIHGWEYKPGNTHRTPQVGRLINKWVYEQLPPGVLERLQELNPVGANGRRKHKHHQHLTPEDGIKSLELQIAAVTTLLRVADDPVSMDRLFDRAFDKPPKYRQERMPLVIDVTPEEP